MKEIRSFEISATKRASHLRRRQTSSAPPSEPLVSWPRTVIKNKNILSLIFLYLVAAPKLWPGAVYYWGIYITHSYAPVGRITLDEWSASRRKLYRTTLNTHQRQISMPPAGFQARNLRGQAAADLRLRPRGYWDRPLAEYCSKIYGTNIK